MRIFNVTNMNNIYCKYSIEFLKKELSLIKWFPNVQTEIHNHKGKRCSYFLLTGPLIETIYGHNFKDYPIPKSQKNHRRWSIGYIDDNIGYHSMKNPCNKNKYSLHYYR